MPSSSGYLTSSTAHIKSLIDYINDVKPYHTKLSEVVEEYRFSEDMLVRFRDSHFLQSKQAGHWLNTFVTDGQRTRFPLTPTVISKFLSRLGQERFIAGNDDDQQITGLTSGVFSQRRYDGPGITRVVADGTYLTESVDFNISAGVFSFETRGNGYIRAGNVQHLTQYPSDVSALAYADLKQGNGSILNIYADPALPRYEEWTLTCDQVATPVPVNFTTTVTGSGTISVTHGLDTQDVFVQVFQDTGGGTLVPLAGEINLPDTNTLEFSGSGTYRVCVLKLGYGMEWFAGTDMGASDTSWLAMHNLRSTDIAFTAFEDTAGVRTIFKPTTAQLSGTTGVDMTFTILRGAGALFFTPRVSGTFVHTFTNQYGVTVPHNLDTQHFCVWVIDSAGNYVEPDEIYVLNDNSITVMLPTSITGKVIVSDRAYNSENQTRLSVSGSASGVIGAAYFGTRFTHPKLAFDFAAVEGTPANESPATIDIGDTFVLTPKARITAHPTAPTEVWSLIKVNPQAIGLAPRFRSPASGSLEFFNITDAQIVAETWFITALTPTSFEVAGSVSGVVGTVALGALFTHPHFNFRVLPGTRAYVPGDYFEVIVENEPVTYADLTVSFFFGYDMGRYDIYPYEARFLGYPVEDIELQVLNEALLDGARFQMVAISPTEFEVRRTDPDFSVTPYPNAFLGVPYVHPDLTFTIVPSYVPFIAGDTFDFRVVNEPPYIVNEEYFWWPIIKNGAHLAIYTREFHDTPASRWALVFNSASTYSLRVSDVSGYPLNVDLKNGCSYRDSNSHFTVIPGPLRFEVGDRFDFTVKEKKEDYLLFGSVSGWQPPVKINEWYWNGKVGLRVPPLDYHIVPGPTVDASKGQLVAERVAKPPHPTATPRLYVVTFVTPQHATVRSNIGGYLEGLTLNQEWTDGVATFTVNGGFAPFETGDEFTVYIVPFTREGREGGYDLPPYDVFEYDVDYYLAEVPDLSLQEIYPLYHSQGSVIISGTTEGEEIIVDKALRDRLHVKLTNSVDRPQLAPIDGGWLPAFLKFYDRDNPQSVAEFSDQVTRIDVHSGVGAAGPGNKMFSVNQPRFECTQRYDTTFIQLDSTFMQLYLNNLEQLTIALEQNGSYGEVSRVKISENLNIYNTATFEDLLDPPITIGDYTYNVLADTMVVTVIDTVPTTWELLYDLDVFDTAAFTIIDQFQVQLDRAAAVPDMVVSTGMTETFTIDIIEIPEGGEPVPFMSTVIYDVENFGDPQENTGVYITEEATVYEVLHDYPSGTPTIAIIPDTGTPFNVLPEDVVSGQPANPGQGRGKGKTKTKKLKFRVPPGTGPFRVILA
jgi:hypothetical protein